MVGVNDMQLGNYYLLSNGEMFRVDYMGSKREGYTLGVREFFIDADGEESYRQAFNEWLEPLEITPQLLRNLCFSEGFDWTEGHYTHAIAPGFLLLFDKSDKMWYIGVYTGEVAYITFKDIKYVHELQNLIYELTKSKLKWKISN